jgi:hypothetical protein
MKNCLLLIVFLSLCLSSCKTTKETDHSLSLDEYRQLGMPDHKHVWNMEDYSSAFFVLNTVKYQNSKALPVRGSERSGILFSRMISMENLSFLQDVTLPLHAKADRIKWFVNTLMELKVAYTIPGSEEQYYVRELIDIDIFRLSVSHQMLALGQQINESDDPSDMAMASDYPQIQQMYLNLLSELFSKHEFTGQIPSPTLELLSDSLSSSVSRNMPWFDEQAGATIKQTLSTAIESSSSKIIKDNYQDLIESF